MSKALELLTAIQNELDKNLDQALAELHPDNIRRCWDCLHFDKYNYGLVNERYCLQLKIFRDANFYCKDHKVKSNHTNLQIINCEI